MTHYEQEDQRKPRSESSESPERRHKDKAEDQMVYRNSWMQYELSLSPLRNDVIFLLWIVPTRLNRLNSHLFTIAQLIWPASFCHRPSKAKLDGKNLELYVRASEGSINGCSTGWMGCHGSFLPAVNEKTPGAPAPLFNNSIRRCHWNKNANPDCRHRLWKCQEADYHFLCKMEARCM